MTNEEIMHLVKWRQGDPAHDWFNERGRSWAECLTKYATWIMTWMHAELTAEQLDECAVLRPRLALQRAADRLTAERLRECAAQYPCEAVVFFAERGWAWTDTVAHTGVDPSRVQAAWDDITRIRRAEGKLVA